MRESTDWGSHFFTRTGEKGVFWGGKGGNRGKKVIARTGEERSSRALSTGADCPIPGTKNNAGKRPPEGLQVLECMLSIKKRRLPFRQLSRMWSALSTLS